MKIPSDMSFVRRHTNFCLFFFKLTLHLKFNDIRSLCPSPGQQGTGQKNVLLYAPGLSQKVVDFLIYKKTILYIAIKFYL